MHTKGHWKVYGSTQYAGFKVTDANGRSIAAFPSTSTRPDAERTANARLIAAAPDLLAALQAWVAYRDKLEGPLAATMSIEDIRQLADEARTVIKKATTEKAI